MQPNISEQKNHATYMHAQNEKDSEKTSTSNILAFRMWMDTIFMSPRGQRHIK